MFWELENIFLVKIVGFLMIPQLIPTYRSIGTSICKSLKIVENHRKSPKIHENQLSYCNIGSKPSIKIPDLMK